MTDQTDDRRKSDKEWREILTPEQYRITREKGTERAFTGAYVDAKTDGEEHPVMGAIRDVNQ